MQAYGLIIAVFVNIFSKETNRQGKAGGLEEGVCVWGGARTVSADSRACLAFSL